MKKLKVDETTNKIAGNHELLEETCSSTIVSQMPQMPKLLNNKELFNSVFISAPSQKKVLDTLFAASFLWYFALWQRDCCI